MKLSNRAPYHAVWIMYMGHFSLVPEPPKTIEGSSDPEEARKLEYFKPLLVCGYIW